MVASYALRNIFRFSRFFSMKPLSSLLYRHCLGSHLVIRWFSAKKAGFLSFPPKTSKTTQISHSLFPDIWSVFLLMEKRCIGRGVCEYEPVNFQYSCSSYPCNKVIVIGSLFSHCPRCPSFLLVSCETYITTIRKQRMSPLSYSSFNNFAAHPSVFPLLLELFGKGESCSEFCRRLLNFAVLEIAVETLFADTAILYHNL